MPDLPAATSGTPAYPLGHDERELDRLTLQARVFEPLTRRLFDAAGLSAGMRVLDVGSGCGDVALLAREFVGPRGDVVGLERAPEAVAIATARARRHDYDNVRFVEGDLRAYAPEPPQFDAVVGRLILMHAADPAGDVRHVARHVRPGGLVTFQDFDTSCARGVPPAATFDRILGLINQTLTAAGSDNQAGLKLRTIFHAAGLPTPEFRLEAVVAAERGHPAFRLVAEVARTVAPLMEQFGFATVDSLDLDTLADRMDAEVDAAQGVIVTPALVGAWTRTPQGPHA
jgi:SAM-dependent methyltransferase